MKIQGYVPAKKAKKKNKNKLFIVFAIVIVFVFVIIVFASFYSQAKQNKIFDVQSFYYVCAAKSKHSKELENLQESVKKLGGAAKIHYYGDYYYLIINVYLDGESANDVAQKNKQIFENIEVLEIKTKRISKKSKQSIKNYEYAYKFVKYFNYSISEISSIVIKYLSGDISENAFCSEVLNIKFDYDDLNAEIQKQEESEMKSIIATQSNMILLYFSKFFNNFFGSYEKSMIACDFIVNLSLLKIEFFNNL